MRLKIAHQFFLALLLSTGSTLAIMALLAQWSIGRGFLSYINQVESERLGALTVRLQNEYARRGQWVWLRDHPRTWQWLLRQDVSSYDRESRLPPPLFPGPGMSHHQPPPPRPAPPPPPADLLSFGSRLTLLDTDGQPVMGRVAISDDSLIRKPLIVKGQTVGWLTLKPLRQIIHHRELDFLRQQLHTFLLIAAALLAGAALLALLLAQQLTRPLCELAGLVKNLASGDYQTHVNLDGKDEIAELGRDINTLAHTLADNQQARQRWIADISHELRTPLTIVRGELEALEDGIRPFDRAGLESLQSEIDRLSKLVEDLHELSLSDLGALSYHRCLLDLGGVLTQAIDTFAIRAQRHGLTLTPVQRILPELPVNGDRERLLQLFSNLLENSVRYTDAGGRIEVTTHVADHTISVFVDDSAPGVALEECPRLFERLYRVDTSRSRARMYTIDGIAVMRSLYRVDAFRSRARGGSGLGLAICQSIVIAHEGTITAQPSAFGGLRISIRLPRYVSN